MSMKRTPPPASWADDINDWLESLKAAGLSEETIRCRRCKMTKAARDLAKTPQQVTGDDLVHWMASQNWKPESRKGYRNTVHGFFAWMRTTGRRADDPSDELPKIRRPKPKPRPCPDRYIIAALHKATPLERVMLRLAAECGLRRAEIAKVNSRDVMDDLVGKSLIITGKGDKQRIVPLPDDLAETIEQCGGWLLPGRWCGHVEQSYVNRHISRLLPDGWGCHSLRHRYATKTYEQTHDLFLVARLLGHASVETTQIYVVMPDSRLRSAMDAVRLAV